MGDAGTTKLDPRRTALLVMDYQPGIIGRLDNGEALVARAREAIAAAPAAGDIVVRKTRVGPFLTTDLDQQLRARRVDTLLLAGISTSGVVLSTVRDAHDRDYRTSSPTRPPIRCPTSTRG
jgi:nicotinamidase-related amidase